MITDFHISRNFLVILRGFSTFSQRIFAYWILLNFVLLADSHAQSRYADQLKLQNPKDEVSVIYEDTVVVQRKAKVKTGSILLTPSLIFDFSDGPQTLYGLNLNLGYALSDFWEVYLQTTPVFFSVKRKVVDILETEKISNIEFAEPESQIGLEVLWLPAYGKDSWGPYSIVRSDTFFKLGIASLKTSLGSGMRGTLGIGKTFFLSEMWNFRVTAGASVLDSLFEDGGKQILAFFDLGLVYYF